MLSYQRFQTFILVFFLVTIFGPATHAQRAPKKEQWEYCAIVAVDAPIVNNPAVTGGKVTAAASICYFQAAGCGREQVPFEASQSDLVKDLNPKDLSESWVRSTARDRAIEGAVAKSVEQLGTDGWEMVGQGAFILGRNDTDYRVLYFKRRK